MGYAIFQRASQFVIAAQNCTAALAAIKALHGREPIDDASGPHFSFVSTEAFLRAESLSEALIAWRWEAEESGDGSVIALDFFGENYGDDDMLFAALAPFVQPGSYLEMVGEDGALWRLLFQSQAVYKVPGIVQYEEPAEPFRLELSELTGYVQFKRTAQNDPLV